MNKILLVQLVVEMNAWSVRAGDHPDRVYKGVPDTLRKYPYVVAIVSEHFRACTGTALASQWVLTAAHCDFALRFNQEKTQMYIQYGNMTITPFQSKTKIKVLKTIPHPTFNIRVLDKRIYFIRNDILLMFTEKISLERFGKLLAVNYQALYGIAAEYAGYGKTDIYLKDHKPTPPLQLGEGVIISCEFELHTLIKGAIFCVKPKCSNNEQTNQRGDSGSPVLVNGKIAGVLYGGETYPALSIYTAVSPHLTWIYNEINKTPK